MSCGNRRSALAMATVLFAGLLAVTSADEGWRPARATWYDVGELKQGNCHFDWSPTGRNVAAWPDMQYGFESSCGKCYEVRCRDSTFQDGYGQSLDRNSACYSNQGKSVVVMITDACPCKYPNNQYSNQRWCCGDQDHLDLSQEAFQQLADLNLGVIGLEYRPVDCNAQGQNGAAQPSSGGNSNANQGQGQGQQQQQYQSQPTVNVNNNDDRYGGWGNLLHKWKK